MKTLRRALVAASVVALLATAPYAASTARARKSP